MVYQTNQVVLTTLKRPSENTDSVIVAVCAPFFLNRRVLYNLVKSHGKVSPVHNTQTLRMWVGIVSSEVGIEL